MKYLSTKDMMDLFNVTAQTIQNWRKEGLPHKKVSKKTIIYDQDEVMEWISKREEK